MKKELYDMLLSSAEADKKKALLSLKYIEEDAVLNNSVGIGDDSTTGFYTNNNAEEALQMLVDADDRIETLQKYWGNKSKRQING
jgi:hypothetical protein